MLTACCFALKDHPDATLILKTPVMGSLLFYTEKLTKFLRKLPAFKCRVVVIGNYLDNASYLRLMQATSFYVNTSYKRFDTLYQTSMGCEGRIFDAAALAKANLPRANALRLIRYMNAVVRITKPPTVSSIRREA